MAMHSGFEKSDYEHAAFRILKAFLNTVSEEEADKLFVKEEILQKVGPSIGPESDLKLYLQVIKTQY